MDPSLLQDLVVVFGLGIAAALVSARFRVPSIVGFLVTGMLVGPHGLRLVNDTHSVEVLAEVGVVMLLFSIGVELSLKELFQLGRVLVVGGTLQVLGTFAAGALVARALGAAVGPAILAGFVVALSSTAIAMRLLAQRAETASAHGRVSLGILVYQDLAVVPMMLAVPFLAGGGVPWGRVALTMLGAAAAVVVVVVVARRAVPALLDEVVKARSGELFVLSILVICLGTAWLTSRAGLSLALGAFLAGLVVSESEYSHQALGSILPFRDALNSLFFVSVGMLLELGFVFRHPLAVGAATAGVIAGKAAIVALVTLALGYPIRIGMLAGMLLAPIGEFSFLLVHAAGREGVLTGTQGQLLLAMTVLTMAAAPWLLRLAPRISSWAADAVPAHLHGDPGRLDDHVIIAGYGVNGRNVARALRGASVPYVILEINPDTVRRMRAEGEPIFYGEATQAEVLRHAGVERARVLVVTIPDASSARRLVALARSLNPGLRLIARTRFVREVRALHQLGASEVVPEEFETSLEIFARVLRSYLVPRQQVERLVREARSEGYEMLRSAQEDFRPALGLQRLLGGVEMEAYAVEAGSPCDGQTIGRSGIKRTSGALVLAVHRRNETHPNPGGDFRLEVDDVVLLLGTPRDLARAAELFRAPAPAPPVAEAPPETPPELGARTE